MAYDLEEQEQLETLKAWWKQYGSLVIWLAIAGVSSFAAWKSWTIYQRNQAAGASDMYEEVQKALTQKENAKVQGATTALVEKYSRTTYASLAVLASAKSAFDAGDMKLAKTQLNWVVEHASEKELVALAKLRLSVIALDEKDYELGLKLLAAEFPAQFEAEVLDHKGDILLAKNLPVEARLAYQSALKKMGEKMPGRAIVQIKLDALGGAVEEKPSVDQASTHGEKK